MSAYAFIDTLKYVELALASGAIVTLVRSKAVQEYWALAGLLATNVVTGILLLAFSSPTAVRLLTAKTAYIGYFYVYWPGFGIEAIFTILTIYSIFRSAMAPLKGLRSLGLLVFKWAAAISTIIALAVSVGPQVNAGHFIIASVSQIQRATSILTFSLVLFVCFAIRPMGLSYRSRIFGVSVGLGVLSLLNVLQGSWIGDIESLNSILNLVDAVTVCATLCVWIGYFAVEEPKRRFILLPTTSPFLRWNQISELLGHNPGYVAVGGFSPDAFASAELEVMRRSSANPTPAEQGLRTASQVAA
jgi:hypothetical protein